MAPRSATGPAPRTSARLPDPPVSPSAAQGSRFCTCSSSAMAVSASESGWVSTADVAQLARHRLQPAGVVGEALGQEAVGVLDAALGVLAGEAEVGAPHAAGPAGLAAAGAAHGGDDQVAGADAAHRRPHLDHLAERLVPQDEVRRVGRGGARAVRGDLAVGAAEAHVEDLHHHVAGGEDGGFTVIDEPERALLRKDGDGFHGRKRLPTCSATGSGSRTVRARRRAGRGPPSATAIRGSRRGPSSAPAPSTRRGRSSAWPGG